MKIIKNFESWKNNIIDNSLFQSGRAKYNPTVIGGIIKYKTANIEPYYYATIEKKGNRFICKIYKKEEDGNILKLRNRIKKELKISHNYVREFLNQKLKKDEEEKKERNIKIKKPIYKNDSDIVQSEDTNSQEDTNIPYIPPYDDNIIRNNNFKNFKNIKPKSKTIIRRF